MMQVPWLVSFLPQVSQFLCYYLGPASSLVDFKRMDLPLGMLLLVVSCEGFSVLAGVMGEEFPVLLPIYLACSMQVSSSLYISQSTSSLITPERYRNISELMCFLLIFLFVNFYQDAVGRYFPFTEEESRRHLSHLFGSYFKVH